MPTSPPGPFADPDAFAGLFERYKNLVYKTAYLMLGDAAEAEEALQEVFVLVYRARAAYDPQKGALTTWLHRITINYCLGLRRTHRLECQPINEEVEKAGGPPDPRLSGLDERQAVAQAIARLKKKQRAVVILRYYWELPYVEIARILEIPLGTVKSRLDLALKCLRRSIDGPEGEAGWSSKLEEVNS